ncbi:putative mitochondrial mitochondrial glycoprotein-like protein [Leptomonas pyrrhocoris]|uniref:Putative mitochondrial mitochondrial glycoprotein-like protein n=1 Tax=Leptomonas pyrrhocoris TaxID=157538 RepID=A0A0M9G2K7_LEPPY|nr:putative mitochondrial mitochondrial glycoprotein-like protein [Leptomonas pyrrhocoris]KPA80869.1 putative mitochondrial mitochondrial glycoprotein-like protein [Leptomonas pyrrhocoris]|eukprot:XP_015659308.1 putative mitochondrial mitochondrial glycoprotein-like protein [Leptomonas pyrrhocoris]
MQRSLLHSVPAAGAYAVATAAAAAAAAAVLVVGRSSPALRAPSTTLRGRPAGTPARTSPTSLYRKRALLVQQRSYATGTSADGVNTSTAAGADAGAIAHAHAHIPSLRNALPPSAVELPEESFLKCIEKEMMDEQYRLDKEEGPPLVPAGWTMHHTEGTSFLYGRRVWVPPPSASAAAGGAPAPNASKDGHESSTANAEQQRAEDGGGDPAQQQQQQQRWTPIPRAAEKHFLRLQLTTRDASLDPECDVRGEHFPFSFFVQRVRAEGDDGAESSNSSGGAHIDLDSDAFEEHTFFHDSIEVRCDVVDGELVVDNVVFHGAPAAAAATTADAAAAGPHYTNPFGGYPGPSLDETEEEVLDGIQSWLAERGVDDQLGEFVGQYAIWIEQAEYEHWLQQLRDYVAA